MSTDRFFKQTDNQANPFDAEKYQELLSRGGTYKYTVKKDEKLIYIDDIRANEKGKGFGSAVMREMIALSERLGFDGNIKLSASYSSHGFYALMGMIPEEMKINYVNRVHGLVGEKALKILFIYRKNPKKMFDSKSLKLFDTTEERLQSALADILAHEKNISKEQITQEDIIANSNFLLALLGRKLSSISSQYIPDLLVMLEDNEDKEIPDSKDMPGTEMVLSIEGKARWKNAIANNIPFEAFSHYDHLSAYMTREQQKKLDDLLDKRAKTFKKLNK